MNVNELILIEMIKVFNRLCDIKRVTVETAAYVAFSDYQTVDSLCRKISIAAENDISTKFLVDYLTKLTVRAD